MKNDCDWYIFKQSTLFNVKNLTEAKNRTIIFLSWIPWVTKRIFVSIHVRQPHNFRRYMIVFCASCVSIVLLRSISRLIRLNQLVIIPNRAHETLFDCFKRRIWAWKKKQIISPNIGFKMNRILYGVSKNSFLQNV